MILTNFFTTCEVKSISSRLSKALIQIPVPVGHDTDVRQLPGEEMRTRWHHHVLRFAHNLASEWRAKDSHPVGRPGIFRWFLTLPLIVALTRYEKSIDCDTLKNSYGPPARAKILVTACSAIDMSAPWGLPIGIDGIWRGLLNNVRNRKKLGINLQ